MQTSIEWLEEQFKIYLPSIHQKGLENAFEKAKEMHKAEQENLYTEEQVRKAYFKGAADVHDKCILRTWRGVETKVDIELFKKLNDEYIQSLKNKKD